MNRNQDVDINAEYIIAMICVAIGFGLIAFSLYIAPNLLFGWQYELPAFIVRASHTLEIRRGLSSQGIAAALILIPFFSGCLLMLLARLLTTDFQVKHRREDEVEVQETPEEIPVVKRKAFSMPVVIAISALIVFLLTLEFILFYRSYY